MVQSRSFKKKTWIFSRRIIKNHSINTHTVQLKYTKKTFTRRITEKLGLIKSYTTGPFKFIKQNIEPGPELTPEIKNEIKEFKMILKKYSEQNIFII